MSVDHPIIAVTGASGAGTTVVQQAFKEIFFRQKIRAVFVEGNGFLRYDDAECEKRISHALAEGQHISSCGPELNDFDALQQLFSQYSDSGSGRMRCKLSEENARQHDLPPGGFTPWQDLPLESDCLFYEGMHGGVVADSWTRRKQQQTPPVDDRRSARNNGVNVAQYVDLLIGVVPAINLQWIQRIHHERVLRKRSAEETTDHIVQQLQDYIHFIVPQFSLSDINFQRMPVVDTSNPFELDQVPADYESMLVVSFREPDKHDVITYAKRIPHARLSGRKSLLIPGGQLQHALDVICAPMIEALIVAKN